MIFQIDISGDALEELKDIETELHSDPNTVTMTKEEWLSNYVAGMLNNRVRGVYIVNAQVDSLDSLKQKVGNFKDIKVKNKRK